MRKLAVSPEWAGAGIRINAIAPGVIRTPMTDKTAADPETGAARAFISGYSGNVVPNLWLALD